MAVSTTALMFKGGASAGAGSFRPLQPGPGLGQLSLQAVLDGENPLGGFQPAGVKLPAKIAPVFEELGDFFLAGAGRKLGGGARQPLRFGLGVRDGHAEDLQQLAGVVVHGLPPSSRTWSSTKSSVTPVQGQYSDLYRNSSRIFARASSLVGAVTSTWPTDDPVCRASQRPLAR